MRRAPHIALSLVLVMLPLVWVPSSAARLNECRVPQDEPTIQAAIGNEGCDVIQLARDSYDENLVIDRDVEIEGRGPRKTYIDGGALGRVVEIQSSADQVSFDHLTITSGLHESSGAGIYNEDAVLRLRNVWVNENYVTGTGFPTPSIGAGIASFGRLVLIDSKVAENVIDSDGRGGGIYSGARLILRRSGVGRNKAAVGGGIYTEGRTRIDFSRVGLNQIDGAGKGAGIAIERSGLSVSNSKIVRNQALSPDSAGGGISISGKLARLYVFQSLVERNEAGSGGGLHLARGHAYVEKSTLQFNVARGSGGAIHNRAKAVISDSTFSNNVASDGGGAIESRGATTRLWVFNSTFHRNQTAGFGGGIEATGGSIGHLTNATFHKNSADNGGGFIIHGATMPVEAVISAGNKAFTDGTPDDDAPDCAGVFTSNGGNVVGDDTGCSSLNHPTDLVADPLLRPLNDNGGPTRTHALDADSPAIGAASCNYRHDQRGVPKKKSCDSGAYERMECKGVVISLVGTGGEDEIRGTKKPDGIYGKDGADRLIGRGEGDALCGGGGHDHLSGHGGADFLRGGEGNDVCVGGPGKDMAESCESEESL